MFLISVWNYCKKDVDATSTKENLPTSFYDAKRLVSKLDQEVRKINCCIRGFMLFHENEFGTNNEALEECKFCNNPRYLVCSKAINHKQKHILVKSMFYLPIIPRLKIMFASMHRASQITWHHTNKISSGTMWHPSYGETWKHFDQIHPEFTAEPKNVRLRSCFGGFTPYAQASPIAYSYCPIIFTPYNLLLEMCMTNLHVYDLHHFRTVESKSKNEYIFTTSNWWLKRLWIEEWVYDISRKQNFTIRAALMWTINDFPAYGMLSMHDKIGCPIV